MSRLQHSAKASIQSVAPVPVILASGSATRAKLLRSAGIDCVAEPAEVDEASVKSGLRAEGAMGAAVAEALAEMKALKISARHRDALVIGADQVLECDKRLYDKPATIAEARNQLRCLRGRAHTLLSAVVVARAGARLWSHVAECRLMMRAFSDEFLDEYLSLVGETACQSVGGYQLEGLGVQLFESVGDDYFAILGLPLLPLLDFLRNWGVVRS